MRRFWCQLFATLLCASSTSAQRAAGGYHVDSLTTESGLPSQAMSDIAQTSDGYLWIATGGILARFDGYTFREYSSTDSPDFVRRVNRLSVGLGDTLWIVDEHNAVFALANGRISMVSAPMLTTINDIVQNSRGQLIAINDSAWVLRRLGDSKSTALTFLETDRANGMTWWRDVDGSVWLQSRGLHVRATNPQNSASRTAQAPVLVYSSLTRQLYPVRSTGALHEVIAPDGRVIFAYRASENSRPQLIDRRGRLWVADASGAEVFMPGSAAPAYRLHGINRIQLARTVETRDGCMWLGNTALVRICLVPFVSLDPPPAAAADVRVRTVANGPSGSVLVQAASEQIFGASVSGYHELGAWAARAIIGTTAHTDALGGLWYDDVSGMTLHRRDGAVSHLSFEAPSAFATTPANDSVVWFATIHNFLRVNAYVATGARVLDSLPVSGGVVVVMRVARDGAVWAVRNNYDQTQNLLRIRDRQITEYSVRDGLPQSNLRDVHLDDDGTVWLGTYGAGLVRFRPGHVQLAREVDGLAENVVTSVLPDSAGNFWMGGNRSIHRVARSQVEALFDGRARRVQGTAYGRNDGIVQPETYGTPGARDAYENLWFPTLGGAVVVDPVLAMSLDTVPPVAHVLGVTTERDTVNVDGPLQVRNPTISLSLGARRLEIKYVAVSLRNPAGIRYEYRIDGIDRDWIDAGLSRVATYTRVGPGHYTFRVRATNAGGVRTVREANLAFVVPAYVYETRAFLVFALAALGAIAWLGYRLRVRSLQQREVDLTRLVDERTAKLERALDTVAHQADELRTLDEAKSRFFANVSHEFRTPLSLILGPVEDLRDGRSGAMPPPVRRRLDNIATNARRLVQLVEQLLDVARLQSGTLHLTAEAHDLVPLVRRMADSFSSLAEHRGIAFRLSCPVGGVRVRYDNDKMEKIIGNLVGNALKFTPAGGTVELRMSTNVNVGSEGVAVLDVQDSGPGIAAEHHARVFERFYQVDDSSRRAHDGVGIGLALAKELVQLHGGEISLVSELGAGCTFTVTLPLVSGRTTGEERVPPPSDVTEEVAPSGVRVEHRAIVTAGPSAAVDQITVLVVEDNADLLAFLGEHLEERYRVLTAPNGLRGLEIARERVPDLIISDVMMPEMDGQSLCEAVKSDSEIDFIPVILLTAKASRDSRLAGLSGGADDYLTKPVDLAELMIRADNLIASRRRVRDRYRAEKRELPTLHLPIAGAPRDASNQALIDRFYAMALEHLADEDFQIEAIASAMGMGRSTLYRKLEPLLGRSPMDALWEYRLAQSAQWLAETTITVSEAAYGVGFKSVPHFCTKFREQFGETPSGYRRNAMKRSKA